MSFKPGFRISTIDILVLITGGISAGYGYSHSKMISFIILFVVGHFFIFCNVTRMSRIPELIWTGIFLILAGSSISTGQPNWLTTFSLSTTTTIIMIVLETRKPRYHGVLWQTINPKLPIWFQENQPKIP